MGRCIELLKSRRTLLGRSPAAELFYFIDEVADEVEAQTLLRSTAGATFDPWGTGLLLIPRIDSEVIPIGSDHLDPTRVCFEGRVTYGLAPPSGSTRRRGTIGASTQRVNASRRLVAEYAAPGETAPPLGRLLHKGDGLDIGVGSSEWTEEAMFSAALINDAYLNALDDLAWHVNDAPFRNKQPGEVLFKGATFTQRGDGNWEFEFGFQYQKNRSNLTVDPISGINVRGWEYLETLTEDRDDEPSSKLIKKVIAVRIHELYEPGSFGLLGI
ncbi:hypothetical protein RAS1_14420 [Phycisphaerae bacterium RAS1]|nr:hypothetical protein RAS1_14420 [Phycisphaerae bacterium RAS1]